MSRSDELKKFARADWAKAERDKDAYWRDWKKKNGPAGGIRIADELRKQVLQTRPGWPSEAERKEDWETHLRIIRAFEKLAAHRDKVAR